MIPMMEKYSLSSPVAIWAVHSVDGMTSDFAKIPWPDLETISHRIVTKVPQINRVVYDITPQAALYH